MAAARHERRLLLLPSDAHARQYKTRPARGAHQPSGSSPSTKTPCRLGARGRLFWLGSIIRPVPGAHRSRPAPVSFRLRNPRNLAASNPIPGSINDDAESRMIPKLMPRSPSQRLKSRSKVRTALKCESGSSETSDRRNGSARVAQRGRATARIAFPRAGRRVYPLSLSLSLSVAAVFVDSTRRREARGGGSTSRRRGQRKQIADGRFKGRADVPSADKTRGERIAMRRTSSATGDGVRHRRAGERANKATERTTEQRARLTG